MGVEILVLFYLAVCLAMILFNIGTIVVSRERDRRSETRLAEYRRTIREELERLRSGGAVELKHISRMGKSLRHPEHLLVFIRAMGECHADYPKEIPRYLEQLSFALGGIAAHYERQRDPVRYALFLYSIREFNRMSGVMPREIAEILLRALKTPNTYCRENALRAIYGSSLSELVLQALRVLDSEHIAHNQKLLSDGLLTFHGNTKALQNRLWDAFESFGVNMQTVILNYMRFSGSKRRDRFFAILTDEARSPELRFCCIRYFARCPDEEAYPVLLDMAGDRENSRWEFAAIACTALASYPGDRTVETLKRALYVSNWYVRYNAAESLARLGVSYVDLIEVIDGNDRYAREILQFQLDMQYNQRKEAAAAQ